MLNYGLSEVLCVGLAGLPTQYTEQGYTHAMMKMPRNPSKALNKFHNTKTVGTEK